MKNTKHLLSLLSLLIIFLQDAFPFEHLGNIPSVYYVGGENASDTNPGTKEAPFATISAAAALLTSGDICYIRAGTYRETVTPKADGVTFRNFEDEYVLITGLDIVTGWSAYRGNILKASFTRETPTPFKATQVFVNGERMHWARYPNQDGNMLSREDMAIVNVDLVEIDGKTQGQATVRACRKGPRTTGKAPGSWGTPTRKTGGRPTRDSSPPRQATPSPAEKFHPGGETALTPTGASWAMASATSSATLTCWILKRNGIYRMIPSTSIPLPARI
jgi:hypothetical protein